SLASGLCVAVVLLPFCACMGATVPFAMAAIRRWDPARAQRSFSHLYLANVVGASLGALAPAVVRVELLGFRRTGLLAAALNAALASLAALLSRTRQAAAPVAGGLGEAPPASAPTIE